MEPPECPVYLQNYDGASTIPRVLTCGHTACQLSPSFPTPSCTLSAAPVALNSSASLPTASRSLPKNIDLLSLSLYLSLSPNPNPKPRQHHKVVNFLPRLWSDELYNTWKGSVLASDAVLVENDEKGRVCESGDDVGLVKVGSFMGFGESEFGIELSYDVKVLRCLSEMREEERGEMGLLRRVGFRVYGDVEDGGLYLVCERGSERVEEKLRGLRNGGGFGRDRLGGFRVVGMGMCEALMRLRLVVGGFGVFVDLREVVAMGRRRRVWMSVVAVKRRGRCLRGC